MRLTTVTGGGVPTRPTDTPTATRHIGSMKQPGLAWVARQMRRQAASAEGRLMVWLRGGLSLSRLYTGIV